MKNRKVAALNCIKALNIITSSLRRLQENNLTVVGVRCRVVSFIVSIFQRLNVFDIYSFVKSYVVVKINWQWIRSSCFCNLNDEKKFKKKSKVGKDSILLLLSVKKNSR